MCAYGYFKKYMGLAFACPHLWCPLSSATELRIITSDVRRVLVVVVEDLAHFCVCHTDYLVILSASHYEHIATLNTECVYWDSCT